MSDSLSAEFMKDCQLLLQKNCTFSSLFVNFPRFLLDQLISSQSWPKDQWLSNTYSWPRRLSPRPIWCHFQHNQSITNVTRTIRNTKSRDITPGILSIAASFHESACFPDCSSSGQWNVSSRKSCLGPIT